MYSAYKLNKQDDNIQPWRTPFPIWNQSVVPCPVLTVASWPAYRFLKRQVRWSGIPENTQCPSARLFKLLFPKWPQGGSITHPHRHIFPPTPPCHVSVILCWNRSDFRFYVCFSRTGTWYTHGWTVFYSLSSSRSHLGDYSVFSRWFWVICWIHVWGSIQISSFSSPKIEGSADGKRHSRNVVGRAACLPHPPRPPSPRAIQPGTQTCPVSRDMIPAKITMHEANRVSVCFYVYCAYPGIWTWVYWWITSQWVGFVGLFVYLLA